MFLYNKINIKLRSESFSPSARNECDQNKLIVTEVKRRRKGKKEGKKARKKERRKGKGGGV